MKITKTIGGLLGNIEITEKTDNKVPDTDSNAFDVRLKNVANGNHEAKIAQLIEQIQVQAGRLASKVDIAELKSYKRLVSEFLDQVVNNSHKFMKENKLDRRGRHRVYAIIKRINEDLEGLTQEVLKEEKDNLSILEKIDDIKGLLLDIST